MIEELKKSIKNHTSTYVEARYENVIQNEIVVSNGKVEEIKLNKRMQGNIRVLKNGQWGFVNFVSERVKPEMVYQAEENAKMLSLFTKERRKIRSVLPVKKKFIQKNINRNPFQISLEEKINLLMKYDRILRGHEKIINTRVIYREREERLFYINSEGSEVEQYKIFTGIAGMSIAREGIDVQIARDSWGGYTDFNVVLDKEEEMENLAKISVELLKAEPAKGGIYDVILDPKLAGVFIHEAFGHLAEADFLYENKKFLNVIKPGRKFGVPELNVIDDGNIEGEAGFIFIDDEGVLPQKTYIIKNGVLNHRIHSRETAEKLKEEPTGNARAITTYYQPIVRMTNTYIDKGKYKKEELFNSVEDGIYAIDYIGGQTNLEMFTFTAGRGFLIKDGKPVKMLKNIMLTGNVFTTLKKIEMIADDLQFHGGLGGCGKDEQSPLPVSTGAPHVKIKNMLIGGV